MKKQQQGQKVSSANYSAVVGQAPFNPMAPGSWLMGMLTPPAAAATRDSQPRYPYGDDWAEGPAVPANHADAGPGYTVPGAKDAHGRPVILNRHAMNAYAAMVRDSGGVVKWSDIASAQRSEAKNRSVGGAVGSPHLGGGAVDTHGASNEWIRKNGARYGWVPHDYSGTHGGHFEFNGQSNLRSSAEPDTGIASQFMAQLAKPGSGDQAGIMPGWEGSQSSWAEKRKVLREILSDPGYPKDVRDRALQEWQQLYNNPLPPA